MQYSRSTAEPPGRLVLYPGSRAAFGIAPNIYHTLFTRVTTRAYYGCLPGQKGTEPTNEYILLV